MNPFADAIRTAIDWILKSDESLSPDIVELITASSLMQVRLVDEESIPGKGKDRERFEVSVLPEEENFVAVRLRNLKIWLRMMKPLSGIEPEQHVHMFGSPYP